MTGNTPFKFWITRPEGTAEDLTQACADHHIDVVQLPLMDINPCEDDGVAARLVMNLDQYSHVIFISGNAVKYGMSLIEQYWPQLPVGVKWLAIGSATARALQAFDVEVETTHGAMNSEALLALPSLREVQPLQRVLIMRGVGGREHLASVLRERGASVDYCELYQRSIPDYPEGVIRHLLDDIGVNGWLASSAETLQNGLALAARDGCSQLLALPIVVPSERVADAARQAGCQRVIEAENAGSHAVIEALLRQGLI